MGPGGAVARQGRGRTNLRTERCPSYLRCQGAVDSAAAEALSGPAERFINGEQAVGLAVGGARPAVRGEEDLPRAPAAHVAVAGP